MDLDDTSNEVIELEGFNPVADTNGSFIMGLERFDTSQVDAVTVYGAGCGAGERAEVVTNELRRLFPTASITVHSDLLAVARSGLRDYPGMAIILGTGMNVGWYDGDALDQRLPSLGYLIGDEGSGADIGRHFLNDLYYDRIDRDVVDKLFPDGAPPLAETIQRVYCGRAQNRALASFAQLLSDHLDLPYVRELIESRFSSFAKLVRENFLKNERERMVVSGGVGSGFSDLLDPILRSRLHAVNITFLRDPMEGLRSYHLEQR